MSGVNGLPVSNQWQETPYFYPVQVSQFGLQHYSRLITGIIKTNSTKYLFLDPSPKIQLLGVEAISSQSNKINDVIQLEGL